MTRIAAIGLIFVVIAVMPARAERRTNGKAIGCMEASNIPGAEEVSKDHDRLKMDMLGCFPIMTGVMVALTDRISARELFLACSALNALSCFGIALSDGLLPALIWRAVSGVAVAGMYMPGLRALTDGMAGPSHARAAAWCTSSFTLGSSLPFHPSTRRLSSSR